MRPAEAPSDDAFGRFFLPGPTEVRSKILTAQVGPMIGHRGPDMVALMAELQRGLKVVFDTARPVFVSSSSATGLMEAAVRNGADGPVLSLVNGAFSERFAEIAEACGAPVDRVRDRMSRRVPVRRASRTFRTGRPGCLESQAAGAPFARINALI